MDPKTEKVTPEDKTKSDKKAPVQKENVSTDSAASQSDSSGSSNSYLAVDETEQNKTQNVLADLFANGNRLITLPDSEISLSEETRRLVALFSDGTYLVSKDHRFDGPIYNFEKTIKRRKIPIQKPQYVSQNEISAIYAYALRGTGIAHIESTDLNQMQLQVDFINIVARAAAQKVSDVHIIVSDSTLVLFRVNGMMQRQMEYTNEWGEAFVRAAFASADISDANYAQNEFQGAQKLGATPLRGSNGQLMLPHNVLAIRLQFNPIAFGSQYLVMRLLYADDNPDGSSDLRALGLGEREENLFYRLRAVPVGLSIIAGPTGSGKSTTLQRNMIKLLQEKNYEINLITVEDPPEYPIPGARQMPVTNANTEEEKEVEFTKALNAALRSDPDVMMVGEIRSLSAAELTFKGALSGHGVWSTLHANSAPAIITRLRDMGVQPYMLGDPELMKGLISQRLFRKLCPHCRKSVKTRENDLSFNRLRTALGDFGIENTFIRGEGCRYCGYKGFVGRLSVPEIILPDAMFLQLMINGDTKRAIDYWTSELDGRPLRDAALERMLKGYIDLDEVERWCGLLDQRPVY
jgi:type II secretory ATPase GspE/PulE/Tfp pilus assembly ATPase PilB-like protein